MKIYWIGFVLVSALVFGETSKKEIPLQSRGISFEYTTMEGSTGLIPCKHTKTSSPYDLEVECIVGKKIHLYTVHLLLNFYTHQNEKSSYELLYWVTDNTNLEKPLFSSSSTWIHNKTVVPQLEMLEVSQGIEQDQAYLKFTYQSPNA